MWDLSHRPLTWRWLGCGEGLRQAAREPLAESGRPWETPGTGCGQESRSQVQPTSKQVVRGASWEGWRVHTWARVLYVCTRGNHACACVSRVCM